MESDSVNQSAKSTSYTCELVPNESNNIVLRLSRLNEVTESENSMLNSKVLAIVFDFLKIDDLKECRLVCRDWNNAANQILSIKAVIPFMFRGTLQHHYKTPERFLEDFGRTNDVERPNASRQQDPRIKVYSWLQRVTLIPLDYSKIGEIMKEFPFRGSIRLVRDSAEGACDWPQEDFEAFLINQKNTLKHLYIDNINVLSFNTTSNLYSLMYNLNPHIQAMLTTLEVSCSSHLNGFTVNVEHLASIKYLRLNWVILNIDSETKLCPKEIHLNKVKFVRDRVQESHNYIYLNEFINFKEASSVSIHRCDSTLIFLNLEEYVCLDYLSLTGIKLKGAENSQWFVKKRIILNAMPYIKPRVFQMKDFCCNNDELNLTLLPTSTESLVVCNPSEIIHEKNQTKLVNLKYLCLQKTDLYCLSYFESCSQLKVVTLIPEPRISTKGSHLYQWCLGWIPKSVKHLGLKITNAKLAFSGDLCVLESLVLMGAVDLLNCKAVKDVVRHFTYQNIVIAFTSSAVSESSIVEIINFLRKHHHKLHNPHDVTVFIGPLGFELPDHLARYPYLNCKKYICFQGYNKCAGIPECEFHQYAALRSKVFRYL